jgi:hypothetical protein
VIDIHTQRLLARDAQLCGDDDQQLVWMRSVIDRAVGDIHTCCPGIIDSFDATSQTVQVKPAIQKLFFPDGEDARWVELPPLVDVPIINLSGAGYILTFPVHSGDQCLLLFAERAIDNWFEQGTSSEPNDARRHSLSDAFALVGIRPRSEAVESYNENDVELRSSDGSIKIQMSGGEIKLVAPTVRIEGQLSVSGSVTAQGDVVAGSISLQGHTHLVTGVQTGPGTVTTQVPQ